MRSLIILVFTIMDIFPASAHERGPQVGAYAWTFDPWVIVPLALTTALCLTGAFRLAGRASTGRLEVVWHGAICGLGLFALAVALVSPIHALGERIFSFHMVEHEIVMAISAPLLVLSRPVAMFLWAMPRSVRHWIGKALNAHFLRRAWNWSTDGLNATWMHAAAIWGWHLPFLLDASVTHSATHRLQHLSFLVTALLFWWSVFWRSDRGTASSHLFVTMMHTSILGALMALSPRVLYAAQTAGAPEWGLTPLEDQQLAGILMWIPAGTIYAGAALGMMWLWIKDSGKGGIRSV